MDSQCGRMPELLKSKNNILSKEYLSELYQIYLSDLTTEDLKFNGKTIKVFTDLNYNLQQQTFEHLTTKGEKDRIYNLFRCEKLPWIRAILLKVCSGCKNYICFQDVDWKHPKNKRYIIWCKPYNYVIILEERPKECCIITAYCVIYDNKKMI